MREYWVIDAQTLTTCVHCEPSADGHVTVAEVPPTEKLVPLPPRWP